MILLYIYMGNQRRRNTRKRTRRNTRKRTRRNTRKRTRRNTRRVYRKQNAGAITTGDLQYQIDNLKLYFNLFNEVGF